METLRNRAENAFANFVAVLVAAALSAFASYIVDRQVGTESLRELLKDMWFVSGTLVGAILALVYRLHSDTIAVSGLDDHQKRALDRAVKGKSTTLWLLALAILVSSAAAVVIPHLPSAHARASVLLASGVWTFAAIFSAAYVPRAWRDLRSFSLQVNEEQLAKERRLEALKRLDSTANNSSSDSRR